MSSLYFYQIGVVSVVDVVGTDATQILHNLTTNDVKKLAVGDGFETFITDVRGKTLGHVNAFRSESGFRLIGAAGQSDSVVAHADRYVIREDAVASVRDNDFAAIVVNSLNPLVGADTNVDEDANGPAGTLRSQSLSDRNSHCYQVNWVCDGAHVVLVPTDQVSDWVVACQAKGMLERSIDEFHNDRIHHGYPWYGTDLTEKNLPQEADRNATAISFTKGCYLGQETVARLDALGQVQKKLVRWSIKGGIPDVGTELIAKEKVVGRLTSVATVSADEAIGIGVARRSHFEAGATAQTKRSGEEANVAAITATVLSA